MRPEARALWVLVPLCAALAACGTTERYSRKSSTVRDSLPQPTVAQDPKKAAEINLGLGKGYFEQGQMKLALEKLERAIKLDPKLADAYSLLALVHEQIGQVAEAESNHKQALALAPKSGNMSNNFGAFLCRQGRYADADASFARALADPFYETPEAALSNRGACARRWGKLPQAEEYLRAALKRRPTQSEILLQLAHVTFEQGDFMRARAFVQRYEGAAKASAESLELSMRIEARLGNSQSEAEYRQRVLAEFPESDQARQLKSSENKG